MELTKLNKGFHMLELYYEVSTLVSLETNSQNAPYKVRPVLIILFLPSN